MNKSRGRPRERSDAKERILAAARARFADQGYLKTSLRAIARDADVDHALVSYYFGSKEGLFGAVADLVLSPAQVLDAVVAQAPPDRLPAVFLRTALDVWDRPEYRDGLSRLLLDSLASEAAGRALREYLQAEMVGRLAAILGGAQGRKRASAAATIISGLFFTRYVLHLEPIASMSGDEVVRHLLPAFHAALHPPRIVMSGVPVSS